MLTIIVLAALYLMSPAVEKWAKPFYYGCTQSNFNYIYVFRMVMETPRIIVDITKSTVEVVVVEEKAINKNVLLKFEIDSKSLNTYSQLSAEQPLKSVVRFLLFTGKSLRKMDTICLQTDGRPFKVFEIEIQELDDPETNVAVVGRVIKRVANKKQLEDQTFSLSAKRERPIEDSAAPSRLLNRYEYIVFIWMSFNLLAFVPTMIRLCTGTNFLCDDYNQDYLSSLYTGLLASTLVALVLTVLIIFYRYLIKYNLEKRFYSSFWRCLRISYLLLVIGIGCGTGVYATIRLMVNKDDENRKLDVVIYWLTASLIGIAVFILFWVQILSVLANIFYFFTKTVEDKEVGDDTDLRIKTKSPSKKSTPTTPRSPNDKEDAEDSDNYFKQLMTGTKVKSISQYKGMTKPATPPPDQKAQPTNASDDESVGDSYYLTLMQNQKKVTSISKYK